MKKSHRILHKNYFTEWLGNYFKSAFKVNNYKPSNVTHYPTILDLHGYSVNDAYFKTNNFIYENYIRNTKNITIITGKSGQIHKEFKVWISGNRYVKNINVCGNGGAYNLNIKRNK